MALTLCPVLFLLSCVTLPSPIHTPRLSLSLLSAETEWHLSLPGMYCTAGTDKVREAEREERVERRSFCLSTPLRYTCHQPTNLPSSPSLLSLLQVNKMRSNSLRELMPGRTRPGYHLLPQASVSSFTRRFIYMCSHHHDSEPFVSCVICLLGTLLPVMNCTVVQRIFYHNISCVKCSGLKFLMV